MNKYQKERNFEETAFEINKGLFLEVMGATDVVSTDYLPDHLAVIDFIGQDKVFTNKDLYRTASVRIRNKDYESITIRGHITEDFSQTKKIYNIVSSGASYADHTVQLNGVDGNLKANSSIIRVNNTYLSNYIGILHQSGELEKHFLDFGDRGRFYEFSYTDLQRNYVLPYILKVS